MRPNEETAILDVIENDIAASTKDTTVYIQCTLVDISNTGVRVEITGSGIDTPGGQDTSHEDKINEDEYD